MIESPLKVAKPSEKHRGVGRSLLSSKVQSQHLERLAIVYIRQSSTRQVEENIESTQLQYQLVDRAIAMGWPQVRVMVIDDDLGLSGRSIEGRMGFQRLLAEVSLEHVGVVLGIEMSRLARSCRDWHQLLELCAVFGSLLGDADGVYDPRDHNDRLLLGLKGTMSEAELHVLRGRLRAGQLNKARRGEYFTHAPIGYVREGDTLVRDPDDQARGVVELIFAKFSELGSASSVLRYLNKNGVKIGVRDHRGPNKGRLEWRPVNQATLQCMLHHPVYAGAYTHGRREVNPRKLVPGKPGRGRRWATLQDWDVLIFDKLPAYITWEQWEQNQKKLFENSAKYRAGGAARGTSLLAGRVFCGRCGRRMSISYSGQSKARFTCDASRNHLSEDQCQAFNARPLHALVEKQLFLAVAPASIELSLMAAQQLEADRLRVERHHLQTIERATYQSSLARGRYEAVDASNRLVAAELERRWEAALVEQRQAEESLERFRQKQPTRLTSQEEHRIKNLATDITRLWHADTTTGIDRQTVLRALLEAATVEVIGRSERVRVTLRWAGGFESHHELRRAVGQFEQLEGATQIRFRIIQLKRQGLCHQEVANTLNAEGFHATNGGPFTSPIVSQFCRRLLREGTTVDSLQTTDCFRTLTSLARQLGVKTATLSTWRRRGWVHADRVGKRWMFWISQEELIRLQQLTEYRRKSFSKTPEALTTPTQRPTENNA